MARRVLEEWAISESICTVLCADVYVYFSERIALGFLSEFVIPNTVTPALGAFRGKTGDLEVEFRRQNAGPFPISEIHRENNGFVVMGSRL